ncbi:MAG TPA: hypothetical protein VK302_11660 [Terriglobales bacterium]|nr:hypothetical protein [Terriglobales bacterium]
MSSLAAPRCRHIKVNGTQCGSPALRSKNFCFYHQQDRPLKVECYSEGPYATGEIALPLFEDAHSIQTVIRQVVQMVLQKRIERKTASLLLYALQIASSNLKRIELEKPQPEQVVTHLEMESETPMAAITEDETAREISDKSPARAHQEWNDRPVNASTKTGEDEDIALSDEDLPPGTIQACYRPGPPAFGGADTLLSAPR